MKNTMRRNALYFLVVSLILACAAPGISLAASSSQAQDVIYSPSADSTLRAGSAFTISWSARSGNVALFLVPSNRNQDITPLCSDGAQTSSYCWMKDRGSFSWAVPSTLKSGRYRILLVRSNGRFVYSRTFSVTASATNTRITVVSPNGGEQWKFGERQTVRWTSQGLTRNVSIYLAFPDGGLCGIGTAPVRNGSFSFQLRANQRCTQLPRTITAGTYKVALYANNGNANVDFVAKDTSDESFTIVEQSPRRRPLPTSREAFVRHLYRSVLDRNPDTQGFRDWLADENWEADGIPHLYHGFFGSQEYLEKQESNEAYVRRLYRSVLFREPEAEGFAYWMERLENGTMTRDEVLDKGFLPSPEFKEQVLPKLSLLLTP